jgi:hypothetical protein
MSKRLFIEDGRRLDEDEQDVPVKTIGPYILYKGRWYVKPEGIGLPEEPMPYGFSPEKSYQTEQ